MATYTEDQQAIWYVSGLAEVMERHGHLRLAPEVRSRLLAMSAATIDRALAEVK